MPLTEEVGGTLTRYYGTFNKSALINGIREYLEEEGYDVIEPVMKQKVGSDGIEIGIKMDAEKKETHYAKFNITVKLRISDMKDVEVVKDGKKVKMQHGRVEFRSEGEVEMDYNKRFEKNKFLEMLRQFYHNYILKQTIDEFWIANVDGVVDGVQAYVRELLDVEAQL